MTTELQPYFTKDVVEMGLDEAGLGPLAGPVFAAAVWWDPLVKSSMVRDSKTLSKRQKLLAFDFIREEAIAFGIASVDNEEIDKINNKQAAIKAMHLAIDDTLILPDNLIVDGNYFRFYIDRIGQQVSHTCIVDGDALYYSIAAASILAKVSHDAYILDLCDKYPELKDYGLHNNMGYGTAEHCAAIQTHGVTQFHRKTFSKVKEYADNVRVLR